MLAQDDDATAFSVAARGEHAGQFQRGAGPAPDAAAAARDSARDVQAARGECQERSAAQCKHLHRMYHVCVEVGDHVIM